MEGLEAVGREIGVSVRGDAVPDDKGKGKGKEVDPWEKLVGAGAEEDKTVWLHCSVGEAMEDDEIEGERIQVSTAPGRSVSRGRVPGADPADADDTNYAAARLRSAS